jgi:hypothetical protein
MTQDVSLGDEPAPGPARRGNGIWERLKASFLLAEHTVVFLRNLSIVGLLGTVIGSYFQYVSWREEQNIARYKQDFDAASATFTESSRVLSTASNLQQIVYFTFKNAVDANEETATDGFLIKGASAIYQSYVDARRSLRESIDVLARKMEIYIDWPSDWNRDPAHVRILTGDPMDGHQLGVYDFDCDKHMPDTTSLDTAKTELLQKPDRPPLRIDWGSAKHHIIMFQYCFEANHRAILAARQWASRSKVDPVEKSKLLGDPQRIADALDRQVARLSALMELSMSRIEDIRLRYQTKNYFCHLFPVRRWCS